MLEKNLHGEQTIPTSPAIRSPRNTNTSVSFAVTNEVVMGKLGQALSKKQGDLNLSKQKSD